MHCFTYIEYLDGFWSRWNCSIRRFGRVERVKKIKDYAFVHFEERIQAVEGEKKTWYESVQPSGFVQGEKWICCESIFNPLGLSSSGIVKDLALPASVSFQSCPRLSLVGLWEQPYPALLWISLACASFPHLHSQHSKDILDRQTLSQLIPRKVWDCDMGCCLNISIAAMNALNGQDLQGARLEISLAKVFDN